VTGLLGKITTPSLCDTGKQISSAQSLIVDL
jgi:hypothetical protein